MDKLLKICLVCMLVLSCTKDKAVLLPEIETTAIVDVKDVSPAYLFYNETLPDSIELNRKNLISTTNWLVNVDKRLTLKQAIPKIKFLQEKKRNAKMHKNEAAKNYFTCNDLSRKNLGFIEFTDVYYVDNDIEVKLDSIKINYQVTFKSKNEIQIIGHKSNTKTTSLDNLENELKKLFMNEHESKSIALAFNKDLNFQEYISIKSILNKLKSDNLTVNNNEFIY